MKPEILTKLSNKSRKYLFSQPPPRKVENRYRQIVSLLIPLHSQIFLYQEVKIAENAFSHRRFENNGDINKNRFDNSSSQGYSKNCCEEIKEFLSPQRAVWKYRCSTWQGSFMKISIFNITRKIYENFNFQHQRKLYENFNFQHHKEAIRKVQFGTSQGSYMKISIFNITKKL